MTGEQTLMVTVTDAAEPPSAPGELVFASATANSVRLEWGAPETTGPEVDGYDVQYRRGTSGAFLDWSHPGAARIATITGLTAGTGYTVRVRASNDEGDGAWSPILSVYTLASAAPAAPTALSVYGKRNGNFWLGWRHPGANDFQYSVKTWKLGASSAAAPWGQWAPLRSSSDGSKPILRADGERRVYNLGRVNHDSLYRIRAVTRRVVSVRPRPPWP